MHFQEMATWPLVPQLVDAGRHRSRSDVRAHAGLEATGCGRIGDAIDWPVLRGEGAGQLIFQRNETLIGIEGDRSRQFRKAASVRKAARATSCSRTRGGRRA